MDHSKENSLVDLPCYAKDKDGQIRKGEYTGHSDITGQHHVSFYNGGTNQFADLSELTFSGIDKIPVKDLPANYSQFGNKGAVWSDETHIAKSGNNSGTMCGLPMLSSNWARIEKHSHIGCPACIAAYKAEV